MTFVPLKDLQHSGGDRDSATGRQTHARERLPSWFKVRLHRGPDYQEIRSIMDRLQLHTICEEARCPNMWECWNARTATFLILGDICTRRCHYCSVTTGRPLEVDHEEPLRVAQAVQALRLRHVVITSVNRDELEDGGASIFAETIRQIRQWIPTCTVEVLIPDFEGNEAATRDSLRATTGYPEPQYRNGAAALSVDPAARQISAIDRIARTRQTDGDEHEVGSHRRDG